MTARSEKALFRHRRSGAGLDPFHERIGPLSVALLIVRVHAMRRRRWMFGKASTSHAPSASRTSLGSSFSAHSQGIWEISKEGREGVKWELGFAFFRGWEMGFCALGLGFIKKIRKMGMGFQFEQHRLGLWDLSWDLKKKKFPGKWD